MTAVEARQSLQGECNPVKLANGEDSASKVSFLHPIKVFLFDVPDASAITLTLSEENTAGRCSLCLSSPGAPSFPPVPATADWLAESVEPTKVITILPVHEKFSTGTFAVSVMYIRDSGTAAFSLRVDCASVYSAEWTFPDGRKYEGAWQGVAPHGQGRMEYPSGEVYEGAFTEGLRDGTGVLTWGDGRTYEGHWAKGIRSGHGAWRSGRGVDPFCAGDLEADSATSAAAAVTGGVEDGVEMVEYDGEWAADERDGVGVAVFSNGARYEGEWRRGLRDGLGTVWLRRPSRCDTQLAPYGTPGSGVHDVLCVFGAWASGRVDPTARAVSTLVDGTRYSGAWSYQAAGPHGRGSYTGAGGLTYDGEWVLGLRHGVGSLRWSCGVEVQGEWVRGVLQPGAEALLPVGPHLERIGADAVSDESAALSSGDGSSPKDAAAPPQTTDSPKSSSLSHVVRYSGEFSMEKLQRQGHGRSMHPDGSVYVGTYDLDRRHGPGTLTAGDGATYDGVWRDDVLHGSVRVTLPDGEKFVGQYVEGRRCGRGVRLYCDGSQYDGQWLHDARHGKGSYVSGDRSRVYDGEWVCGHECGRGIERVGELVYVGEFDSGVRHGSGTLLWKDGRAFHGKWVEGVVDVSFGSWVNAEGDRYMGSFDSELQKHGRGVCVFAMGGRYDGEWRHGQQHGSGVLELADGSLFSGHWGEWKGEHPHGSGLLSYADGTGFDGRFERGVYVL